MINQVSYDLSFYKYEMCQTSEELYSQSEAGRMNEQTTVSSICPYTSVGNQLGKSKQLTEIIGCLTQIPFSIIIGMCCM